MRYTLLLLTVLLLTIHALRQDSARVCVRHLDPPAQYPTMARLARLQGTVTAKLEITSAGTVADVAFETQDPMLIESTILQSEIRSLVRTWTFECPTCTPGSGFTQLHYFQATDWRVTNLTMPIQKSLSTCQTKSLLLPGLRLLMLRPQYPRPRNKCLRGRKLMRITTTMKRPHLLISGAWLAQTAAWFLPAVTTIFVVRFTIPGWQAFLIACGAWKSDSPWYGVVLSILSAITALLFIVGSPWVVFRGTRSARHASAWVAAAAFCLNAQWLHGPYGWDVGSLGVGYFLWWSSFILLALGLFDLARRNDAAVSAQIEAPVIPNPTSL
jgi:Gram-negative bacterial TonB protein C-terminal